MKKVLSAILCLIMLVSACLSFAGCGEKYDEDYTGPIIPVYFSEIPTTFDPQLAYLDNTALPVLNLMYEGLYKYDAKGKVVKGLATGYKWIENDDETGTYVIEIGIRESRWNDQTLVSADDFVFAWRRLLNPENISPAASMLYMIDNAYEIRNGIGDITQFDLGVLPVKSDTLRITFAEKPNMDLFLEYLASPALVPLRETSVKKTGDNDWASQTAIIMSNGPFFLKNLTVEDTPSDEETLVMRLERNRYYKRCIEEDKEDLVDAYVKPYRLEFIFGGSVKGASDRAYESYLNGEVLLNALQPLSVRNDAKAEAEIVDTLSTHTYMFNTNHELFKDANVRKALSLAIDRNALAELVVFAKAAEGIIPGGVFETTYKSSKTFREKAGALIAASADLQTAKELINKSGIKKSTAFEITVKATDEVAIAVAEAVAKVWNEQLGLNCSIRTLGYKVYDDMNGDRTPDDPKYNPDASEYENLVFDLYLANYLAGGNDVKLSDAKAKKLQSVVIKDSELKGFDIIAVDMQQLSMDAFSTLASYATYFNGGYINLGEYNSSTDQDENAPIDAEHLTGYRSEAYNQLINKAYAEKDLEKRAEILHEAEKMLLSDMPVMPLFVYQNGYQISDELTGISYGWGGVINFTKVKYPSYVAPVEDFSQSATTDKQTEGKKDTTETSGGSDK